MPQIFANSLAMTLGGSLLALLLWGLKLLLGRKLSSSAYYYLWLAVLLRFVLPAPGLIPAEPEKAVLPAMEYVERSAERVYEEVISQRGGMISTFEPREVDAVYPQAQVNPVQPPETPELEHKRLSLPPLDIWEIVIFIYIAGAVIRLAAYVIGYLRFSDALERSFQAPERLERRLYEAMDMRKKPELLRSAVVKTPMLMGLIRPRLILPGQHHSVEELRCIYRHELMHYRRGDILYKWFSVLVFSVQWFNPLCILIRREISRSCELSCDEMLISRMDRLEKQAYGNTLISLAASGALPAGVIATTFATEKRDLKERLEQIMKYKNKSLARTLAMLLAFVMLIGCGAVLGPRTAAQADTAPAPAPGDEPIYVSTVDELLAAIGPDRQIWLRPGVYELDKAANYGGAGGEYYSWQECFDGYELVIHNVDNMELHGVSEEGVSITALARYANVLRFNSCTNVMISYLTLGHDEEPGSCSGGVVYLSNCDYVHINESELYGCGIIGVQAENCTKVFVTDSDIYDCSTSAVTAYSCYDVRVTDCDIYDCDAAWGGGIFEAANSTGFAVVNCDISDTLSPSLLTSSYSQQTVFLGNEVESCNFGGPLFYINGYPVVLEGCAFDDDVFFESLSASREGNEVIYPVTESGEVIDERSFIRSYRAMEQRDMIYEGPITADPVELDVEQGEDGRRRVKATNMDEFLAAIGPDTIIELVGDIFDMSTAADYGSYGRQYYYWNDAYDGPELVISGVENLSIIGEGVTIAAIPRYANVLNFINCENIELVGFTAGHTEEPGSCTGGVLNFQNTEDVRIDGCHLFGCGTLGISAYGCEDFTVSNTEIYECSNGGVWLGTVENFLFENCDIHDCAKPEISLHDARGVSYNGEILVNGMYTFKNGALEEMVW